MTFFSSAALDAAPVGATPALRVSTNYMETFLPLQPVSSGTEIQTYLNTAGMLDIYSVGTNGRVYRYRRTDATLAPYEEADLGIRASQLYFFDAAGGRSNTPSIFGLNSDSKLTLATYQSGGYGQRNTGPQNEVIRHFLGVRGVTGRIYINVRLSDGRLCTNYYEPQTDKWGGPVWAPVIGPDGKDAVIKDMAMAANNPVQSALFAIGMDDEVLFAEDSFRTSRLRKLNKKASHIAAIADSENLLNILAVERDTGLLWVKRQRKRSTSGIQFDDWVQVDPGQSGRLGRLTANLRRDGLIEVFALNEAVGSRMPGSAALSIDGRRLAVPTGEGAVVLDLHEPAEVERLAFGDAAAAAGWRHHLPVAGGRIGEWIFSGYDEEDGTGGVWAFAGRAPRWQASGGTSTQPVLAPDGRVWFVQDGALNVRGFGPGDAGRRFGAGLCASSNPVMDGAGNLFFWCSGTLYGFASDGRALFAGQGFANAPEENLALALGTDGSLWTANANGGELFVFRPHFARSPAPRPTPRRPGR